MNTEWMSEGVCRTTDPAPFFPEHGGESAIAKAICHHCPVQQECLTYAVKTSQSHGVWGGRSFGKDSTTRPHATSAAGGAAKAKRDNEIRRLYENHVLPAEIARILNCSSRTVHRAVADGQPSKVAA